ncbi:MAG TPA: tetratricopeptide repeat protein [Planctomycetota bacterium]|nr:tetratricopeptide repeat protein [Planctomycetota bacterium]
MTLASACLLAAVMQAPGHAERQAGEPMFVVRTLPQSEGAPSRMVVSADARAVHCLDALHRLGQAAGWNVTIESRPLEDELRIESVDLDFANQDPRMAALLIAVAGGADCILQDAEPVEGARSTLHVVRPPSADTPSGRQRLRALAQQWYRSFLRDELQHEPIVQQEAARVRMDFGRLLVESGDLDAAIAFFAEASDMGPHDRVAEAILRVGQCHFDLARGHDDREKQIEEFAKAEEWARKLLGNMPRAPEVAPATVLLGKAMLGQATAATDRDVLAEQAQRCESELQARVIRLPDSVETLEVWLLAGLAQFHLEQPEAVHETVLTLRESSCFAELTGPQLLDYHFLLGYGALGRRDADLAMRSFEWFLIHAGTDPRCGIAQVLLAESYLEQKRFVEARAASVEARTRHLGTMSSTWRERALRTWAKTALALGEKEKAFLELELIVSRGEEPALALFLVDELLADRQWQRAISVARPLASRQDAAGDEARFKTLVALYEQAAAGKHLAEFPPQAVVAAPRIADPELQGRTATMIGDAYMQLGMFEHAADAYRGILR